MDKTQISENSFIPNFSVKNKILYRKKINVLSFLFFTRKKKNFNEILLLDQNDFFIYISDVGLKKSLDKPIHNSVEYFDKNDRSFTHMNFKLYRWHILPYSRNLSWRQFFFVYLKTWKIVKRIVWFFLCIFFHSHMFSK